MPCNCRERRDRMIAAAHLVKRAIAKKLKRPPMKSAIKTGG